MEFLLKKLPYMDPSAKTLFRPDLDRSYMNLLRMTDEIDVLDAEKVMVEAK